MKEVLHYAISRECSDIHITEGKQAKLRQNGELADFAGKPVSLAEIDEFVEMSVPDALKRYVALREGKSKLPVDGAFVFAGRRFRVNIYKSMSGINAALRLLSDRIQSLDTLYLPDSMERFTELTSGLVLVVGTTGSGKSTTLASVIDAINHKRRENILCIEQPIEYVHKPDLCRIEQIEVGVHVESFNTATVAAMRQDPDIILVGEMRDLPTIQNAITLAETGHIVFATLHAKSIPDTIDRLIDVFPAGQQEQIRFQVSSVLRGIVQQRLVKNTGGGRIPLVEILFFDDVTASMLRQRQKSNALRDYLRGKSALGNVHIADNAAWHAKSGRLNLDSVKNIMSSDDYTIAKSILSMGTVRSGVFE